MSDSPDFVREFKGNYVENITDCELVYNVTDCQQRGCILVKAKAPDMQVGLNIGGQIAAVDCMLDALKQISNGNKWLGRDDAAFRKFAAEVAEEAIAMAERRRAI